MPISFKALSHVLHPHHGHGHSRAKHVEQHQEEDSGANHVILHPDAHADGGISCNDDRLLKEMRDAINSWLKSMGRKVLSGNFNIINTPMPVTMFEPRSYLEKLADVWVYPRYLQQASATSDPVERMRLVVTWFIAGLHHGFEKWKKPFNPVLGETWQAHLSDGTTMFMEQISHHPPVTAFNLLGPGGAYRFVGLSQPNVAITLRHNGFKTVAKGYRFLEFADGTRIDIVYPGYYIKGVVSSKPPRAEVEGSAVFYDSLHRLKAVLRFGHHKGAVSHIMKRSDAVTGEVYQLSGSSSGVQELTRARGEAAASHVIDQDMDSNGSEDFETASESDWDLRDVSMAEATAAYNAQGPLSPSEQQGELLAHAAVVSSVATFKATSGNLGSSVYIESEQTVVSSLYGGMLGGSSERHTAPPSHLLHQAHSSSALERLDGVRADQGSTLDRPPVVMRPPMKSDDGVFSGFNHFTAMSAPSASPAEMEADEPQGEVVARIQGSWLSHLDIDNQRYWTLSVEQPDSWQPAEGALQSDSRFREDLVLLSRGDKQGAQTSKEKLENRQRADRKTREAGGAHLQHNH